MFFRPDIYLYKPQDCNNKALVLTDSSKRQSLLISYETRIIVYDNKKDEFVLGCYIHHENVSKTTKKHITSFLNYISKIYKNNKYENKDLNYILNCCKYVYNDNLN